MDCASVYPMILQMIVTSWCVHHLVYVLDSWRLLHLADRLVIPMVPPVVHHVAHGVIPYGWYTSCLALL